MLCGILSRNDFMISIYIWLLELIPFITQDFICSTTSHIKARVFPPSIESVSKKISPARFPNQAESEA